MRLNLNSKFLPVCLVGKFLLFLLLMTSLYVSAFESGKNVDTLSVQSSGNLYITKGATIYNAQEIKGNIKIIQKITKVIGQETRLQFHKKNAIPVVIKTKKEEVYTSSNQIKQSPSESNYIFSRQGRQTLIAPSTYPQNKVLALLQEYYLFIPIHSGHNSKYIIFLSNEINYWQMCIRPPPVT